MPQGTQHKIAKSEKLAQVAKKYGHKDWKLIWKDKSNTKISKLRGKPENLQPGDVVFIPMTPKQSKELGEHVARVQESLVAETKAIAYFTKFSAQFRSQAKLNRKYADATGKDYDNMIKAIQTTIRKTKNTALGVDISADIALLFVGVGKFAGASKKAATANADQLAKINADATAGAIDFMSAPVIKVVSDATSKQYKEMKGEKSMIGLAADATLTGLGNLTIPSFWGTAAVKLHDGASWGDAVTTDLEGDLKKRIEILKKDKAAAIKRYKDQAVSLEKRATEFDKLRKASESHAKNLERELNDLAP